MLLVVALSVFLCACASGVAGNPRPGRLVYRDVLGVGRLFFEPAPTSWSKASKFCQLYDATLVYPENVSVANQVWELMDQFGVPQVHVGFHDQFIEGTYYTFKGKPINQTNFQQWSSGAPIGDASNNCGGLKRDGLIDVSCDEIRPSVCVENGQPTTGGFKDYIAVDGHGYFKFNNDLTSWSDAFQNCSLDGSHPWIINSAEEHSAVYDRLNIPNTPSIWVGVHHRFMDKYFLTIFGDTLESTGYTKWIKGEPSGTNIQYPYVAVSHDGLSTQITNRPFICEYNPGNAGRV